MGVVHGHVVEREQGLGPRKDVLEERVDHSEGENQRDERPHPGIARQMPPDPAVHAVPTCPAARDG
ncbi:hypothetical protein SFR_3626 [Streptomyces sp. FR-008]|nr:hypothetical protein SFR_3626 [Streptomyces sp. FR-008]